MYITTAEVIRRRLEAKVALVLDLSIQFLQDKRMYFKNKKPKHGEGQNKVERNVV